MIPHAPDGYVLIPQQVFATFVVIVALACIIELGLVIEDFLKTKGWYHS